MKQNVDYGYDIQKVYLEMMLSDAESFVRCQGIFDSSLFDRKLQKAAQFLYDYVGEHNVLPTQEMVIQMVHWFTQVLLLLMYF